MSEVLRLHPGQTTLAHRDPRPELIETLEKLLELARAGEIRALAAVAQANHAGHPDFSAHCVVDIADDVDFMYLLGGLTRVTNIVNQAIDDGHGE